jgi:hypothetical protein
MLKPGVGSSRINQETVSDLTDVSEALYGGSVQRQEGGSVDPNIVPEGIADYFGGKGWNRDSGAA